MFLIFWTPKRRYMPLLEEPIASWNRYIGNRPTVYNSCKSVYYLHTSESDICPGESILCHVGCKLLAVYVADL